MLLPIHQDKVDEFLNFLREAIATKAYDDATLQRMNSILVEVEKFQEDTEQKCSICRGRQGIHKMDCQNR